MRLDKYLKLARLIKRRTLAKEAAAKDRIDINGKTAKPSSDVKVGDVLTLSLGFRITSVKVTSLETVKDGLMYDLISDEKRP
ncbi:MAG: RNA-binding S4 domain-containing protein [Acholeplasmataceae bacterium]|nr:RNA-binding S4 domain-containing protein [Acholeplasmataceae bacterium]